MWVSVQGPPRVWDQCVTLQGRLLSLGLSHVRCPEASPVFLMSKQIRASIAKVNVSSDMHLGRCQGPGHYVKVP